MQLTFVADESIDKDIVERLRSQFDVTFINGDLKGLDDDVILILSKSQNSILLTADKDFGELVFRLNKEHTGIVLCRLHGIPPKQKASLVAFVIDKYKLELIDSFTVIQPDNVRIRKRNL
jgi:predicted nuclease of predicted toxin-antitoxin system